MNSFVQEEISIDKFINIYYFEFGKYFRHPPECHNFWEMVYVDKGKTISFADGISSILEEGQAVFHKPGEYHTHISDNEVPNNLFVVSFECQSEIIKFFENKTFTLDKTSKTLLSLFVQETKNALGRIIGDYYDKTTPDFTKGKFGSFQLMRYHFTEFLINLIRGNSEKAEAVCSIIQERLDEKNIFVTRIISYLEYNIYNKITLNDICNNFFVKKTYLSSLFKEHTGKSPMRYYADLKIEEAKKLLRDNTLSVTEISDRLGYSGIHYFSKAFKEYTGFSPTAYKRSIIFLQKY